MTELLTSQNHESNVTRRDESDSDIRLFDLAIVFAKYKKSIVGLTLLSALMAAGISLALPNIYTAKTAILPPQGQSSSSALLSQLGGLVGLGGIGALAGAKSPNDLYIGMLKSRTVADNLIERFDLNKVYAQKYQSDTRKRLEGVTTILAGKDGIITIEADDKDPKRAAELANAYVDELFKLTKVLAVTEASQRRLFFERQFELARDNLAKAESVAKDALDKGGLIIVEGQGRAILEAASRLRGQITVKEVQIGAMRTFATDLNPELQLAQKELESMKRELARIEGQSGNKTGNAQTSSSSGMSASAQLRNVKYYETVYELLAKQYELAKIDEAKDSAVVQVMDKAIEPDKKSKPFRALIVLVSALAAALISILWAFYREAILKAQLDPQQAARIQAFRRHLSWR